MESSNLRVRVQPNQVSPVELPSLLERAESNGVAGFDTVELGNGVPACQSQPATVSEAAKIAVVKSQHQKQQSYAISISMPASPSGLYFGHVKSLAFGGDDEPVPAVAADGKPDQTPAPAAVTVQQVMKPGVLYSQPMPAAKMLPAAAADQVTRCESQRDTRFDPFKTWSGRLERQLSNLRGKPHGLDLEANDPCIHEADAVPGVDRYFDALEGPELDTLRASEVTVLPEDKKWPFLLRFPVNTFGMCLGVSSQAILWKTLATSSSMRFMHVSLTANLVLWFISLALMAAVSFIYLLKVIFYFEAVRREYYHPVRVNFFFAPWIACLFLALGVPPSVAVNLQPAVWYVLMAPIFCLELKIYGQWMSGGERRLSKVANPSNHLSIVGNFVGALLGASMGLKEGPIFFFAVGLAHYIVLFVTLYQRLPTNATLPKELHPVFFLFVAAPSVACMAWAKIRGDFDNGSKIAYFIAIFLYVSLAVRVNFFRGIRFSLAWWAYTFPMTGASIATIKYSLVVTNPFTQFLSVGLSAIATFTVTALLITTIVHAFILRDLFPNDVSIAITQKKPKFSKFLAHLRSASSDMKDIEANSVSSKDSEI